MNNLEKVMKPTLSEQDLTGAEYVLKAVAKYGLEIARAEIAAERAKLQYWQARQRLTEVRSLFGTKMEE